MVAVNVSIFTIIVLICGTLYLKFGTSEAKVLEAGTCSKEGSARVANCLEPMIQLSEVIALSNPVVNRIVFPLYNFRKADVQKICTVWNRMHQTCLTSELRIQCANHPLMRILRSLFVHPCSDETKERFFDTFQCISDITSTHQACIAIILVSQDPSKRPRSKCDPIPRYYSCLSNSITRQCGLSALTVFEATLGAFGCPLGVDSKLIAIHNTIEESKENSTLDSIKPEPVSPPQKIIENNKENLSAAANNKIEFNSDQTSETETSRTDDEEDVGTPGSPSLKTVVVARPPQVPNFAPPRTIGGSGRVPLPNGSSDLKLGSAEQEATIAQLLIGTKGVNSRKDGLLKSGLTLASATFTDRQDYDSKELVKAITESQRLLEEQKQLLIQRTRLEAANREANSQTTGNKNKNNTNSNIHQGSNRNQPITADNEIALSERSKIPTEALQPLPTGPELVDRSVEAAALAAALLIEASGEVSTCSLQSRARARACLTPVMTLWKRYTTDRPILVQLSLPIFFLDRGSLLDVCDAYASAFLDCSLATYQECSSDPVVEFADATFGYACGNAIEFFRSYECLSVIAQDSNAAKCREGLLRDDSRSTRGKRAPIALEARCQGVRQFYNCIQATVLAICPTKSLTILKETINYYGCEV